MIKNYEGVFILEPHLKDEEADNCFKNINQSILSRKGEIVKEERWGKRSLAYPIQKHKEGNYYLLNFKAPAEIIANLKSEYRLMTSLIRFMIVKG